MKSEATGGGGAVPPTPLIAVTVDDPTSSTPTLTSNSIAGATITIYDGTTAIGTTTANGSGAWTWKVTPALGAGAHVLTWTATNSNGSSGHSPAVTVTVGGGSGGSPPITAPAGGSSGGCGLGGGIATLLLAFAGMALHWRSNAHRHERRSATV